jgi:protein-L-isoaspartate(D-aspartate) O-methyltransferase
MEQLIRNLIEAGRLKDLKIREAFTTIDRIDFVPSEFEEEAYADRPLYNGHGQTISQPQVVAFMLELLHPLSGDKIFDIGSGSGWQTALLAHIVGEKGLVAAIERIPELFSCGKKNCEKYHFKNIEFILGDATLPYEPDYFFDKIIASASSKESVPEAIKQQLKIGGTMVMPVGESIFSLTRINKDNFSEKEFPGFFFVPLVSA